MDAEKYIKREFNGFYTLLFPNHSLLSKEQIEGLFSEFGRVKNVKMTGDERGHRFVQYGNLDEARWAVEGLRKHPQIELRVHRLTKGKMNRDKSSTASALSRRMLNNGRTDSEMEFSDALSERSSSSSGVSSASKVETLSSAERNGRCFSVLRANMIGDTNENEPRELEAYDVVVANMPECFGEAYFLHLFEKYEPLAISRIQVVLGSDLRYCYVYFKKHGEAIEVQRRFDRYSLSGMNLIVMRPGNLMLTSLITNQRRRF